MSSLDAEDVVKKSKLWLDDIRRPPDSSWLWARTLEDAKLAMKTCEIKEASLDHDLGLHEFDPDAPNADEMRVPRRYRCEDCETEYREISLNKGPEECSNCHSKDIRVVDEPDGMEFAEWLVEEDLVPIKVVIHSWNHQMAEKMADVLRSKALHLKVQPYERPGE